MSAGSSTQKLSVEDVSLSESATSFKIVGGYQATPMFGVEVAYVRFGEASVSGNGASVGSDPTSFYAALTGTVPVSPAFNLFAKLGAAKSKTTIFASEAGVRDEFEESGTSAVFGIGAQYKFSDTMSLVAEYENFGKVAKDSESIARLHWPAHRVLTQTGNNGLRAGANKQGGRTVALLLLLLLLLKHGLSFARDE